MCLLLQVFDCHFPPYTVQYMHNGNPLLEEDTIRLNVYYFTKDETLTESILLNVIVVQAPYDIFVDDPRLRALEVRVLYDLY